MNKLPPHGNISKKLRARKGVSARELANEMGVSSAYFSDVENGKASPSDRWVNFMIGRFKLNVPQRDNLAGACLWFRQNSRISGVGLDWEQTAALNEVKELMLKYRVEPDDILCCLKDELHNYQE